MVYLFSLAVVFAVVVLVWALWPSSAGSAIRSNLGAPWQPTADPTARPRREGPGTGLIAFASRVAGRLTPSARMELIEQRIGAAGLGGKWPAERVLAAKTGCAMVAGILLLFWTLGAPSIGRFAILLLVTAGTFFLPDLVLSGRADERRQVITRELPDVVDQLVICIEAGLGLDAALARIADIGKGPLAEEFGRMMQEVRLGIARSDALEALAERADVPDLHHVASSLRQAEGYGIPILQVLRTIADELRDSREQRAEEAAQKVPVKMLFPLLFCIFPALLIVLTGPSIIRIGGLDFG